MRSATPPDPTTSAVSAPALAVSIQPDDPEYVRLAREESAFWDRPQPFAFEAIHARFAEGVVARYTNRRFTGDEEARWYEMVAGYGPFGRSLILGAGDLSIEARILETNPSMSTTIIDISEGSLERHESALNAQFPGRISTQPADLNFVELAPGAYDVIISASTIHHVTNLERVASQVNAALAPGGHFFLQDYAGESRFQFSEKKKRVFEEIIAPNMKAHGWNRGLSWFDESTLSPFCAVRSQDILPVFREFLDEVEVRPASALLVPAMRSRPAGDAFIDWQDHTPRFRRALHRRLPRIFGPAQAPVPFSRGVLEQLMWVGDLLAESGVILPGNVFAVYRKKA